MVYHTGYWNETLIKLPLTAKKFVIIGFSRHALIVLKNYLPFGMWSYLGYNPAVFQETIT